MTTRYNIGIKKHFLSSCLCLILLFIISSCKETTTSRSLSEQEFHYDDRLSTLAIDKKDTGLAVRRVLYGMLTDKTESVFTLDLTAFMTLNAPPTRLIRYG